MNDKMLRRAEHWEVSCALHDLFKVHRNRAFASGLNFFEFLMNDMLRSSLRAEQEELCISLGWALQQHEQFKHNAIMAEMKKGN